MTIQNRTYKLTDIIRLPFGCSALHASLLMLQKFAAGVVPTLQVLVSSAFINTALSVLGGRSPVSAIYPGIAAIVALIAYTWIAETLSRFSKVRLESAARVRFRGAITEKRAKLLYQYIEDNDTWDLISRVAKAPETQIKTGYENFLTLISIFLQVGGLLVLLLANVWWAALAIIGFTIPMVLLAIKSGQASYEANREVTKLTRRSEYLAEVLSGRDAVEERTLFGYGNKLNEQFRKHYETARKIEMKTLLKWFIRMKAAGILVAVISLFIAGILIPPVLSGKLSIGLFISIVTAVFSLMQVMSWQLTTSIDELAKHTEYLKDLTGFSALTEQPEALLLPAPAMEFQSLELKNVRFKYPGTENYILDGLSMHITPGNHYAIVGINGAGKTTMTKLLQGLYDDYEGEILINGKQIREYSQSELKSFFSVVYQDFAKYYVPFRDNIALGDANNMDSGDDAPVLRAVESLGLQETVDGLPAGLGMPLGKISEGGQDLSGGQWQRVAMARSLVSPAPLRILDEPTAALDPTAESRLYEEFEKISRGRTTIFISHRLGSTKLANRIYVLSGGRVAEQGTHAELMAAGGEYAAMYESQRSWYL